jgi:Zn-dependent M28 family amino/carboxypeptidase
MGLRRLHGHIVALALGASCWAGGARAGDIYQTIYQSVDQSRLQQLLKDMTGVNPVTAGGSTFSLTDRYLPASKANYRKYWTAYFQGLGMQVKEMAFDTSSNLETQGHDLEAVLPGKSADSIVIIVHYDSIGPHGADNPGVDDDMTGMAMAMETARILSQYKGRLHYTVRFVAADYEEWGGLEGARYYAQQIQTQSQQQGFKLVAAIDDEQSGWKEGDSVFDVYDCGGATDSSALGKQLIDTAAAYGKLGTTEGCMGENSDHYAMWEIGVPAVVFSEHDPFNNGHFDHEGGDTYDKIDQDYYFQIAQVGVTFAAKTVGIDEAAAPAPERLAARK